MRGALSQGQPDPGRFTIVRHMPPDRQGPIYRIKGDSETHERVAQEAHLETIF